MTPILTTVQKKLKEKVPAFLNSIGGTRVNKEKLSAQWSLEAEQDMAAQGLSMQAEVASAFGSEFEHEIVQRLYNQARLTAPLDCTLKFDGSDLPKDVEFVGQIHENLARKIVEVAHRLGGVCSVIVSPTALTILQSAHTFDEDQPELGGLKDEERFIRAEAYRPGNHIVGTIGGHTVIVDPFATDDTPVLVAAPEWFTYKAGTFIYVDGPEPDPATLEMSYSFYPDCETTVDGSKLAQIGIDVATLRFF